jgi:hypothetical protein
MDLQYGGDRTDSALEGINVVYDLASNVKYVHGAARRRTSNL